MGFTDIVRKAALPAIWSQGVTLARGGASLLVSRSAREITGRVRTADALAAPEVTLYLEDEEWSCTCPSRVDPCPHVVALSLAIEQGLLGEAGGVAAKGGAEAPRDERTLRLRLRHSFSRSRGTLYLERFVVFPDGREERLTGSLLRFTRTGGAELVPTEADLTIDRIANGFRQDIVPTSRVREILGLLETADLVDLDGHPVRTSRELSLPIVRVTDGSDGSVVVTIDEDPGVTEVVACGIVRRGDELSPMGAMDLTGEQRERLPATRLVARPELGSFALEILPQLEAKAVVFVETRRLPGKMVRTLPRLSFDMKQEGGTLSVLPLLVYGDPPVARIDGDLMVSLGPSVPARERAHERVLVERLRGDLDLVVGRRAFYKGDDAARFLSRLVTFSGEDVRSTRIGGARLVPRVVITPDLRLEVSVTASDDPDLGASADAVLSAWKEGLSFVPLDGGGFAPLPADWLERFGDRVYDLLAARRDDGTIPRPLLRDLARLAEDLDLPPPKVPEDLERHAKGLAGLPAAVFPADLRAELRPYQVDGVRFLQFSRKAGLGAVLADDMGLGKTVQVLAALPAHRSGRTLVVCPRSVMFNWEREIARFRPGLTVSRYHGADRDLEDDVDIVLTTYGTLRRDIDALKRTRFACVVLDEAQAIKNPGSQSARAAFALDADFRVALSGTPVENRLLELYSLVHFTNPWMLGKQADFIARFEDPIAQGDAVAAARLREKTTPILLRRTKKEVAPELPPRTESVLFVELEEDERDIYDAVKASTRAELVRRLGEGLSPIMALEALLRLRQASCHPGLLPGQTRATSSKLERLAHALEEAVADGHKALVFSQWTSFLDLVEPRLGALGLSFVRLDGSTRDREGVVDAFQAPSGPPVMLVSLKAGGMGLNLTAADHVFLLDPWWNPAVEDQAADRTHRIGQDKPVFVHRLVSRDTVEERVLALAEKKRKILGAVIVDGTAAVRVTEADLMALLD